MFFRIFLTPAYLEENFLVLQYSVDRAIIQTAGGDPAAIDAIDVSMRRCPYPAYIADNFVLVIQQQLPLLIMLSFVFYSMQIVKDLVYEKENKLKVCF